MALSGHSLRRLAPFDPFVAESRRALGRSYGLSHAGYDVRLAQGVWLLQKGFTLASTYERFRVPWNLLARVHDKSTNIRLGIAVQNTVAEPNWQGFLTLELENKTWGLVYIPPGTPIAQIVFERVEFPLAIHALKLFWRVLGRRLGMRDPAPGYRGGKYDDQKAGPQPAILEIAP